MRGRSDSALLLPKGRAPRRVKPARYENKGHLSWLHDWSCALAGCDCEGPVVVHHLLRPGDGLRGMGRKAGDQWGLPMCDGHHRSLHAHGNEDAWFADRAGDPEFGRTWARKLWETSPHFEEFP